MSHTLIWNPRRVEEMMETVHVLLPLLKSLCFFIDALANAQTVDEANTYIEAIRKIRSERMPEGWRQNESVLADIENKVGDFARVYDNCVRLGIIAHAEAR